MWGVGASGAYLYPILGKEGTGISLHGQLEASGIPPEWAAAEEQASGPFLAAAVALTEKVWRREIYVGGKKGSEDMV